MVDSKANDDDDSLGPSNPQFSLKALLWFVTGICVLLVFAVDFLPELLGQEAASFLLIVAFVSYPFAIGIAAEFRCRKAGSYHYFRRFAIALGVIGVIPAILLNYPRPRIYMVAPTAGLVLVFCFAATGAFIGSLVDLKNRNRSA